jgi:hypothetical protein
MVLIKDGQTINLDNESHISAYLASGWTEAKATVQPAVQAEEKQIVDKKAKEKRR